MQNGVIIIISVLLKWTLQITSRSYINIESRADLPYGFFYTYLIIKLYEYFTFDVQSWNL